MKYFIANKNKAKSIILSIFPMVIFLSVYLFLRIEHNINLYALFCMLLLIPIYIYFTDEFKKYNLSVLLLMTLTGIVMQIAALWVTVENVYDKNIFYYFLLLSITFYYFLLFFDIKKANKISKIRSIYLAKLIHKIKVKKDENYYIDDEKSTLDARHNIPDDKIKFTTLEPLMLITVFAIFIAIFGRTAIALDIFTEKYFPKSDILFIFHALAIGNMFFLM
jgi:hypothetical protein